MSFVITSNILRAAKAFMGDSGPLGGVLLSQERGVTKVWSTDQKMALLVSVPDHNAVEKAEVFISKDEVERTLKVNGTRNSNLWVVEKDGAWCVSVPDKDCIALETMSKDPSCVGRYPARESLAKVFTSQQAASGGHLETSRMDAAVAAMQKIGVKTVKVECGTPFRFTGQVALPRKRAFCLEDGVQEHVDVTAVVMPLRSE